ncbi:DUF6920 family protein [Sporolactobacillus pectinivorans]|uniref:DUF6920 family protein n=1 Tax=Sporolactobacillus pectinivorans TaxID=1591408 RepID=UPI000C25BB02|nr:DUF6544 family protein [Sporolactobacillus pectinivorans]
MTGCYQTIGFQNPLDEIDGKYVLSDWGGVNTAFREFNGMRIPCKSEIVWKEETEDFDWFRLEITDIDYNLPVVY